MARCCNWTQDAAPRIIDPSVASGIKLVAAERNTSFSFCIFFFFFFFLNNNKKKKWKKGDQFHQKKKTKKKKKEKRLCIA